MRESGKGKGNKPPVVWSSLPEYTGEIADCFDLDSCAWTALLWEEVVSPDLIGTIYDGARAGRRESDPFLGTNPIRLTARVPEGMRNKIDHMLTYALHDPTDKRSTSPLEDLCEIVRRGFVDFSHLNEAPTRGLSDLSGYVEKELMDKIKQDIRNNEQWGGGMLPPEVPPFNPEVEIACASMPLNEYLFLLRQYRLTGDDEWVLAVNDLLTIRQCDRDDNIQRFREGKGRKEPHYLTLWKTVTPSIKLDDEMQLTDRVKWTETYGFYPKEIMIRNLLERFNPLDIGNIIDAETGKRLNPLVVAKVEKPEILDSTDIIPLPTELNLDHRESRTYRVFTPIVDEETVIVRDKDMVTEGKNLVAGTGGFGVVEYCVNTAGPLEAEVENFGDPDSPYFRLDSHPRLWVVKRPLLPPSHPYFKEFITEFEKEIETSEQLHGRRGIARYRRIEDKEEILLKSEPLQGNLLTYFNMRRAELARSPLFSNNPYSPYNAFDAAFMLTASRMTEILTATGDIATTDMSLKNFMVRKALPGNEEPSLLESDIDWDFFHPLVKAQAEQTPLEQILAGHIDPSYQMVLIDLGIAEKTRPKPDTYKKVGAGKFWFVDEAFHAWGQHGSKEHDTRSAIGSLLPFVEEYVEESFRRPEVQAHKYFQHFKARWRQLTEWGRVNIYEYDRTDARDEDGKKAETPLQNCNLEPAFNLMASWRMTRSFMPLIRFFNMRPPCDEQYTDAGGSIANIYTDSTREIEARLREVRAMPYDEKIVCMNEIITNNDADTSRQVTSEILAQFSKMTGKDRVATVRSNTMTIFPEFRPEHLSVALSSAYEYMLGIAEPDPSKVARAIQAYTNNMFDTYVRGILLHVDNHYAYIDKILTDMIDLKVIDMHERVPKILISALRHPGRRFSLKHDTRNLDVLYYINRFRNYVTKPEEYITRLR